MGEVFTVIFSLAGILALILALFYASKWLNKKTSITSAQNLRIVERANLSTDKMLLLVEICGKYMVVGVAPNGINTLCELNEEEIARLRLPNKGNGNNQFLNILTQKFRMNKFAGSGSIDEDE
ncbi:MAG: flagellar biosynthetic protein FliO [Clostridiales bacterium]|nr:flagellar biosynthetic protein FliO [Clostridiales bacterium]